MGFRAICVALLLSILPVAGCGTATNLARSRPDLGGRIPFGGVKQDLTCIRAAANGEVASRKHPRPDSEHYPQLALMLACAADLPFSLIGDVVTWPYTASYTFINQPPTVPPVIQGALPPPVVQVLPGPYVEPLSMPSEIPVAPMPREAKK